MKLLKTKKFLAVLTILCLLLVQLAPVQAADANKDLEYLKSIMDMIKEKHKGEVTDKQLIEGALKGMFGSMDPYTTYFTLEEADTFLQDMNAKYKGIGVVLSKVGGYITADEILSGSPAQKAGLEVGDRILAVDGKDIKESSIEDVTKYVKSKTENQIALGIMKKGQDGTRTINVAREEIRLSPITYQIKGDIGYIRIESFTDNTDFFLTEALKELDSKNIKNIILDLRYNPGGQLDQAVAVAGKFVPQGLITKLDYQSEEYPDKEYYSELKSLKYKLVVLVNEASASASEVLAGAMQDTKAGTLIGTKTFGKAKVQVMIPLLTPEAYAKYEKQLNIKLVNAYDLVSKYSITPMDDEIIGWSKITIGEYTTPAGKMIDQKGIEPDIAVQNTEKVNGIYLSSLSKMQKTMTYTLHDEAQDVFKAKKILGALGYEIGELNIQMDEKTLAAVQKFQAENGLFPYEILDLTTQQALNDRVQKILDEQDLQYNRAVEVLSK